MVARKESGSVFGQQASINALALSLASSTSEYSAGGQGEIILDKIKTLSVSTLHNKQVGTFVNEPQLVKFILNVTASKKGQDESEFITKTYNFIARARNVSMLP